MKVVMEQQVWWKRPFMLMLTFLLVVSSVLPVIGGPTVAKAEGNDAPEAEGPGGVSDGLISWVDMERSKIINETTSMISGLTDLADDEIEWGTYQGNHVSEEPAAINFNGGAKIANARFFLTTSAKINPTDNAREIFSVQSNPEYYGFPWEFGGSGTTFTGARYGNGIGNEKEIISMFGRNKVYDLKINVKNHELKKGNVLNIWSAPGDWSLSLNGESLYQDEENTPNFLSAATRNQSYIGAGHSSVFIGGNITETILFNRKLEGTERAKVNSYLALKYGLTLNSDYVASDGTTNMWTAGNGDYSNRITGIGRDANGNLNQKQSKSHIVDANITLALGNEIKETNALNTNAITNDKSFFVFGDNGEEAKFDINTDEFSKDEKDLKHLERIYKVEKTNWIDQEITLEVDKVVEDASDWPLYLVVSEDETFDKNDSFHKLTDGKVKLNSSQFGDGDFFTIAAPSPKVESSILETEVDKNTITLTFDEEVKLEDSNGFTIKVGDDDVDLIDVTFTVDPTDSKKVIITLPTGTDVTDKVVTVIYNAEEGNLQGKSGVPVSDFEETVGDPFASALKITKPTGNPAQVTESKPEMTGKVVAGSEVKVVIKDKDGNEVTDSGGAATVDQDGNWTFTPGVDLTVGEYTVEVTATNDDKTAIKTKEFEIKTAAPTDGPGGISRDLISWIKMDESVVATENVTALKSVTSPHIEWSPRSQYSLDQVQGQLINFHPATKNTKPFFENSTDSKNSDPESGREILSVQIAGTSGFPWELGGPIPTTYNTYQKDKIQISFGSTISREIENPNEAIDNTHILNVFSAPDDWGLSLNGHQELTDSTNTVKWAADSGGAKRTWYIGAAHSAVFNGNLAEVLVFNSKLTPIERQTVNSYLALKYGLTLKAENGAMTNYIASDGSTIMWTAANNADYGQRVTGIGRDDKGTLNQKQSKAQLDGANVTIALGDKIEETNTANENEISTNKSFFVFSDNGKDATFTTNTSSDQDESLKHLERISKVEKTNFADTNLTFNVDKVAEATKWPLYLVVSEDATFTKEDSFHKLDDKGNVTLDSNSFNDGDYFTIAARVPTPEDAKLAQLEDGQATITIPFDEEVVLTNGTGFTVKVGEETITGATFTVDPDNPQKIIITLPTDTDVAGKKVKVSYDGTGNLTGTNGVPVNNFEKVAELPKETETVPYTAKNEVTTIEPDGVTYDKDTDKFTVPEGVDTFTFKDGDKEMSATKDADGNWIITETVPYTAEAEVTTIAPTGVTYDKDTGKFTVPNDVDEFTFKDGDKEMTATKDAEGNWIIAETVPYTAEDEVTTIAPDGVTYDKDTGKFTVPNDVDEFTFKDGDKEISATKDADGNWIIAEIVPYTAEAEVTTIAPTGVTYDKDTGKFTVPEGVDKFTFKDGDKEMTATKGPDGKWEIKEADKLVDKSKLQTKHDDVANLTSSPYTSATWGPFETARTTADTVLKDPNATQQQVNDALQALEDAHNALKRKPTSPPTPTVDKSVLQEKSDDVSGLTEGPYTEGSWQTFTDAQKAADEVLKDPNATQQQVDKALADLDTAHKGLVDKSKLQAQADEAAGLQEKEYTPDSWKAFENAKTAADNVLKDPNATQKQVDDALDALKEAQNKLVPIGVDKSKLQAQADEAAGLQEKEYIPDSWKAFKDAKTAADNVLKDPNATQKQVDDALDVLKDAQNKLVPIGVDKSKLQAKVDEAAGLTEKEYTPGSWKAFKDAKTAADNVLKDPNATQKQVDDALDALKDAQNKLVPQQEDIDKSMLQARVDAVTGLKESDYTPESWANLQPELSDAIAVLGDPNATQKQINDAYDALAKVHDALVPNSTEVEVDKSALQKKADEAAGLTEKEYTSDSWKAFKDAQEAADNVLKDPNATQQEVNDALTKLIAAQNALVTKPDDGNNGGGSGGGSSGGGSSGGGGSSSSSTETIIVDLEIDGDQPIEKTSVEIKRTKEANGQITDRVELTPKKAQEAVNKALEINNNIARIVIPDPKDEVDKVTVEVPAQAIKLLKENGIDLEIYTGNVLLTIPQTSMEGIEDDFYFRLVPVKKESERKEIEARAKKEEVVRQLMGEEGIHIVARPMTIETNLSSRPVLVTLPLRDVNLPTNPVERANFLKQLGVFIEHSDGEKEVVFGKVVTLPNNELGLQISVTKFSTFTMLNFGKKVEEDGTHQAYIKGFPDGTFKPNQDVTRKQIALMIARNLGYTDGDKVDVAPFNDVSVDADGAGAIAYLKELGIMTGDENGNFRGSAKMTRGQMAAVVARYKELEIQEVPLTFTDTNDHWAKLEIEANRAVGIISGYEDGTFKPHHNLSRAHAVKMINGMFDRGPLHGVTTQDFPDVLVGHWAFIEIAEAATTHSFTLQDEKEWIVK